MAEEGKSDQTFHVKDRRRFAEDGTRKEPTEEPPRAAEEGKNESPRQVGSTSSTSSSDIKEKAESRRPKRPPLPAVDFPAFVISLSSSVLIHLGMVPDPTSGSTTRDLPLAKQTIDILTMLKEKTKGNLTDDESKLMENLLYDLKMRYVEAVQKEPS